MTTATATKTPPMTARYPTSDARFSFMTKRDTMKAGDLAEVSCSHQCTVMLMDDENLAQFIDGRKFHYYGGFYKKLPAQIPAPTSGDWNVVVHMGASPTPFAYSITFKKR